MGRSSAALLVGRACVRVHPRASRFRNIHKFTPLLLYFRAVRLACMRLGWRCSPGLAGLPTPRERCA